MSRSLLVLRNLKMYVANASTSSSRTICDGRMVLPRFHDQQVPEDADGIQHPLTLGQ